MITHKSLFLIAAASVLLAGCGRPARTPFPRSDAARAYDGIARDTAPDPSSRPADAKAATRAAAEVLDSAGAALKVCLAAVRASPEYAPLLPRNLPADQPAAEGLNDPSLASDDEIRALRFYQPKLLACRGQWTDTIVAALPEVRTPIQEHERKASLRLSALIDRRITWGEYLTEKRAQAVTLRLSEVGGKVRGIVEPRSDSFPAAGANPIPYATIEAGLQTVRAASAAEHACQAKVYASPSYAPLAAHQLHGAAARTLADFSDPSLANDAEIRALAFATPRLNACRTTYEAAEKPVWPTIVDIRIALDKKRAALLGDLTDRKIGWGQYLTQSKALSSEYAKLVDDERSRVWPNVHFPVAATP